MSTRKKRVQGNNNEREEHNGLRILHYGYNQDREIKWALKNNYIHIKKAKKLRDRLNNLAKNDRFIRDWEILKKKVQKIDNRLWAEEEVEDKEISFDSTVPHMDIHPYFDPDVRAINRTNLKIKEITNAFLKKYRIDAIENGKPFIYISPYNFSDYIDNAGRHVIKIEVPAIYSIETFRELIEKNYSKKKRWIVRNYIKEDAFRAKWGEISGKAEYYKKRNVEIQKRYLGLKQTGITDEEAYYRIYIELKLDRDMKDWNSIKPIVAELKKKEKKNYKVRE